jgi:ribosome-binding protein aMBF1 (putative translation factor)
MTAKQTPKSPALRYTYERYIKGKPEREASYEAELANAEVASMLYDLRTKAGLSQRELAKLVGTTASVICRLEDADYEGHSMAMLKRIAEALNKRVEIRFVSIRPPKARRVSHEQSLSL